MKLVTKLAIERFRSLKQVELDDLGHLSVLAGLNNSGKSNVLRALNAFFSGEVEPGVPIRIDRDYYRQEWTAKKRKVIRVKLTFSLPPRFKYRAGLEQAEQLLGRDFTLEKVWGRDSPRPEIFANDESRPLSPEQRDHAELFLQLIAFRYIPNRVIPTELMHREQQALRDVLIRRLARLSKQSSEVFNGIQATAASLIASLASDITRIAPDVTSVRLATASSLADLAFRFGYRLTEDKAEMEELEQGSGMQSLLMFQTLHLIDRDYFQRFGWKQAALWAVEEPESSLHAAMEPQVARFLSTITQDPAGRLQGIATTHSDLMMQYSDRGYSIDKRRDAKTGQLASHVDSHDGRELVEASAKFGVSRWVNPILFFPLDPLVLVEGKYDRDFLREALKFKRASRRLRIECLEDLADPDNGGVDTLKAFVRSNKSAIKSRPNTAPVVAVLDWDAANKKGDFLKGFQSTEPFKVIAWDASNSNPRLDKTFRGIERFLPDRIVDQVSASAPELIATKANGTLCAITETYGTFKQRAWNEVLLGLRFEDLAHAHGLLDELLLVCGAQTNLRATEGGSALAPGTTESIG